MAPGWKEREREREGEQQAIGEKLQIYRFPTGCPKCFGWAN